jgi:HupE / UreJ protein
MNRQSAGLGLLLLALSATNASAHHVMGGRMPATFMDGLLSGLGHPIIGIDHFAAVVAVGCLAATHNAAPTLVIGFIAAMMAGVTLHLHGASVPAAELLVAVTVIALGALLVGTPADADGSRAYAFCSRRTRARLCTRGVDIRCRADADLRIPDRSWGRSRRYRACGRENCAWLRGWADDSFAAEARGRRHRRSGAGSAGSASGSDGLINAEQSAREIR